VRYYPSARALRGFAIGALVGMARAQPTDCVSDDSTGACVYDGASATGAAVGVFLDYSWLLGRSDRFYVGTGSGRSGCSASMAAPATSTPKSSAPAASRSATASDLHPRRPPHMLRPLLAAALLAIASGTAGAQSTPAARAPAVQALSVNPLYVPFGGIVVEYERAAASRGLSVGVGAAHYDPVGDDDDTYSSAEVKVRFYPGERALRGFSLGLTAGVGRADGETCCTRTGEVEDRARTGRHGRGGARLQLAHRAEPPLLRRHRHRGEAALRRPRQQRVLRHRGGPAARLQVGVAF
jgi:hypothetical protein